MTERSDRSRSDHPGASSEGSVRVTGGPGGRQVSAPWVQPLDGLSYSRW